MNYAIFCPTRCALVVNAAIVKGQIDSVREKTPGTFSIAYNGEPGDIVVLLKQEVCTRGSQLDTFMAGDVVYPDNREENKNILNETEMDELVDMMIEAEDNTANRPQ